VDHITRLWVDYYERHLTPVGLGETVTILATVRNFSGEPARNVDVRFYQGDPANNLVIGQRTIPSLSRESGPEEVSITWTAAGVGQQKIYAVIDPYDNIPEMHDEDDLINNNMAYGLIQLAATNFADMGLVAEQPPYDAISYALGDPKPTVSLYVPRASLDAVARFEVGGTEIGLPVEGRVFEVAAYQGSKYKMWSDPIANFNLKPGANDPPAVISVAYTEADISALDENSLKLYRLVGTNWTEATCPGYQIHRFPVEDLIAVPICQTGIFAFSDVAPGPILGPVAQFSATPLSGPPPLPVTFTDLSSNYPTSWSWDFGDGATSTAQNPTHTYSEPGTYDVSLTVSNEADSNTHTRPSYINVYGMQADFTANPVRGTAPLTVTFTDLSVGIGIPGPTSWAWDFGDGITDTLQHPTHTYFQNGAYTVTLTVSNADAFDTKVDQNCVTVADVTPAYLPVIMKNQQ
jgi:PKD repeat protein